MMLLVPVYTDEHHLVWALPAMASAMLGVWRGRLGAGWAALIGLSWAALGFELAALEGMHDQWLSVHAIPAALAREAKLLALLALLAANLRLAVTSTPQVIE